MDHTRLGYFHLALESKVKYRYNTWFPELDSNYTYNFESIAGDTKHSCNNYINLMVQATRLYVIIYINNGYINLTKLDYLHPTLGKKDNCIHITYLLKLDKFECTILSPFQEL